MTRPPQPQEYPGNLPADAPVPEPVAPPVLDAHREYKNPLTGEPYEGSVWVIRDGIRVATVPLVDGVFDMDLPSGHYRLTAEVVVDGQVRYMDSEVMIP